MNGHANCMSQLSRGLSCFKIWISVATLLFLALPLFYISSPGMIMQQKNDRQNSTKWSSRKILGLDRIGIGGGEGEVCAAGDIVILQGQASPLPNGIPTYSVQLLNMCVVGGCPISNIHVSCGWFASAKLVNPGIFRRLRFNDCLVNDGRPLNPGDTISFEYANSFHYPFRVSSATVSRHCT